MSTGCAVGLDERASSVSRVSIPHLAVPTRRQDTMSPPAAIPTSMSHPSPIVPTQSARGAGSGSARFPSRLFPMLAVVAAIMLAGGCASGTDGRSPADSPAPGVSPAESTGSGVSVHEYLATADELRARAALAGRGVEPYASAVRSLLLEGERAMQMDPRPEQPLEMTGVAGAFVGDSANAYTLALSYVVSGQRRYSEQAGKILDAWAATATSTLGTCAHSGACLTSLAISRTAPAFVFAADLIGPARSFDEGRFRAWLRDVILPAASERTNNWGDAGAFMRLAVTAYLGDGQGFGAAVAFWRSQLDAVAADGHIPEETRRGSDGLLYTQGALSFKTAAARLAQGRGIDLWEYRGKGGATLRNAVDYLATYWSRPQDWPWHQGGVRIPSVDPFWELVYALWPSARYAQILEMERPFGASGNSAVEWTTLTNGIAIGGRDR